MSEEATGAGDGAPAAPAEAVASPAIKRKDSEVMMRLNTMSPQSAASEADSMLLGVELDQITDIAKLFEKADLDMQATPNMMVQCVLVDGSGEDVHPDERFESDRVPDLAECFPITSELDWTFGRTYDIVQQRLEDLYLQVRLMRLEVKRPPEAPLSPPVTSPVRETKGGIRSSPMGMSRSISMRRTSSVTPKRGSSVVVEVNVLMIATAEISLSCFPTDGSPHESNLPLKDGAGFKAKNMDSEVKMKFTLRSKMEKPIEEEGAEEAGKLADTAIKKFFEYNIEPSAGKIGSLPQRGSRRTRVLSISGRVSDHKATSRGAMDVVEARSSIDNARGTERQKRHSLTDTPSHDSETEQLIRHMDSTFNNTLMVISERFQKLDATIKAGKAKEKQQKALEYVQRMVVYLGRVNTLITMVARGCDKKTRIASNPLEPDTVEEGMATCKYTLSTMQTRFTQMMGKLKNKIRHDIDVDKIVLDDESSVANALERIDGACPCCL